MTFTIFLSILTGIGFVCLLIGYYLLIKGKKQ
jgi:hypothetical protein